MATIGWLEPPALPKTPYSVVPGPSLPHVLSLLLDVKACGFSTSSLGQSTMTMDMAELTQTRQEDTALTECMMSAMS